MLKQPDMMDPEREFAEPATAAAVTMTAAVSQNRQIVIQSYLARDSHISEYHALLDKMTESVARQEARLSLKDEFANLALEEKTLLQLKQDFGLIEERAKAAWDASNRRGPFKLSPQEQAQKTTALTTIQRYEDAIHKRKVVIAELRATAGV